MFSTILSNNAQYPVIKSLIPDIWKQISGTTRNQKYKPSRACLKYLSLYFKQVIFFQLELISYSFAHHVNWKKGCPKIFMKLFNGWLKRSMTFFSTCQQEANWSILKSWYECWPAGISKERSRDNFQIEKTTPPYIYCIGFARHVSWSWFHRLCIFALIRKNEK